MEQSKGSATVFHVTGLRGRLARDRGPIDISKFERELG